MRKYRSYKSKAKVKYHSYCCQNCGENIGWIGRYIFFSLFHKCKVNMKDECEKCAKHDLECVCVLHAFACECGECKEKWKALENFRLISTARIEHDQKKWENIQKSRYLDKHIKTFMENMNGEYER